MSFVYRYDRVDREVSACASLVVYVLVQCLIFFQDLLVMRSTQTVVAGADERIYRTSFAAFHATIRVVQVHGIRWDVGTFFAPVSLTARVSDLHIIFWSFLETRPIALAFCAAGKLFGDVREVDEGRVRYENVHFKKI
jgi:hypothetical protein